MTARFTVRGVRLASRRSLILCVRAARLLKKASGSPLGRTSMWSSAFRWGRDLGGGSSDAATCLVALNHLCGGLIGMSDVWRQLGLKLGADVPVFVRGRAAWAEGVGEKHHAARTRPTGTHLKVTI